MMRASPALPGLAVLLTVATASATVLQDRRGSPVSRVVTLLTDLRERLEKELKEEENAFKKHECWQQNVVDSKTAANAAAQSRVESLEAHISDVKAGKVEFTTERVDLEKQVGGLRQDLEQAKALRDQEREDFKAAKSEMREAIDALTEAIAVLEDGTEPPSLLARSRVFLGARASVARALELGRGLLAAADAKLLQGVLSGEPPERDWKKLNRKATFKMKYGPRSTKIIKTLKDMNTTFSKNLADAEKKEADSQASYEALKKSKEAMLETSEVALTELVKENGARGLSMEQATAEVDALKAQIEADTAFIEQVKAAHDSKSTEWEERKSLRNQEIVAISEAISVLHSDDARDAFSKSFKSQGYLFLQLSQFGGHRQQDADKLTSASRILGSLGTSLRSPRLSLLSVATDSSSIQTVIAKIDQLVTTIKEEEASDLSKKEDCESSRAKVSREAQLRAGSIDGLTEEIVSLKGKASTIASEIEEEENAIVQMKESLQAATRQYEDDKHQLEETSLADKKAVELVAEAETILETMRTKLAGASFVSLQNASAPNRTSITQKASPGAGTNETKTRRLAAVAQKAKRRRGVQPAAGEAPPPPPATWESPYSGAEGESKGIMGLLAVIKGDLEKNIAKTEAEAKEAEKEFEKEKADLEASITAAEEAITSYTDEKAAAEQLAVEKAEARADAKAELQGSMDELKALKPGCDFITVNFEVRNSKRQAEIDGLFKAKAILKGAKFSN